MMDSSVTVTKTRRDTVIISTTTATNIRKQDHVQEDCSLTLAVTAFFAAPLHPWYTDVIRHTCSNSPLRAQPSSSVQDSKNGVKEASSSEVLAPSALARRRSTGVGRFLLCAARPGGNIAAAPNGREQILLMQPPKREATIRQRKAYPNTLYL
jgi:hypothetical protein